MHRLRTCCLAVLVLCCLGVVHLRTRGGIFARASSRAEQVCAARRELFERRVKHSAAITLVRTRWFARAALRPRQRANTGRDSRV